MQRLGRSIISGLVLFATLSASAHASEPVTNTLTVQRVVQQPDGQERTEPAAAARPGNILEYAAEFHNAGPSVARGLEATLPIPVGTALIQGSVRPPDARASLDGTTFAAMPLTRKVRRPDGSVVEEPVPIAEYRFLRWPPTDLAAKASLVVRARVTVSTETPNSTSSGKR